MLKLMNGLSFRIDQKRHAHIMKSCGTLGGGNHYIELGKSPDGQLWLTVHSGSRGLGVVVAKHHQQIQTARQEFERQLLAGELTNIEQYFGDMCAQEERYLIAKHGINVDRVIDMDGTDVIVRFIRDSVHKDQYDEWKDHPDKNVRLELAMHGYFLEQYIHDTEPEIREEVMNLRLDLGLERMFNLNDQEAFLNRLKRQR